MAEGARIIFAAVEAPVVDVQPGCLDNCDPNEVADDVGHEAAAAYAIGRTMGAVPDGPDTVRIQAHLACDGRGSDPGNPGACAMRAFCVISPVGGGSEGAYPAGPTTGPIPPESIIV